MLIIAISLFFFRFFFLDCVWLDGIFYFVYFHLLRPLHFILYHHLVLNLNSTKFMINRALMMMMDNQGSLKFFLEATILFFSQNFFLNPNGKDNMFFFLKNLPLLNTHDDDDDGNGINPKTLLLLLSFLFFFFPIMATIQQWWKSNGQKKRKQKI